MFYLKTEASDWQQSRLRRTVSKSKSSHSTSKKLQITTPCESVSEQKIQRKGEAKGYLPRTREKLKLETKTDPAEAKKKETLKFILSCSQSLSTFLDSHGLSNRDALKYYIELSEIFEDQREAIKDRRESRRRYF